jgi:hypothetical protein
MISGSSHSMRTFRPQTGFDQASIVVVQGILNRFATIDLLPDLMFFIGKRCLDAVGGVQATERAHAIDAAGPTHLLVVGEFQ